VGGLKRVGGAGGEEQRTDTRTRLQGAQSASKVTIAPSLLASDWCDIKSALEQCEAAARARGGGKGRELWLHIDMFDGVAIDSPHALTFGPQMVAAIRARTRLLLDVHLVVDRCPSPSTPNPSPSILNPHPQTLNPKP